MTGPAELVTCDQTIERHYCHIKQWRGLATRYDKHAIIYRAAVVLNAVIVWTRPLSDTA
jgi:transposase